MSIVTLLALIGLSLGAVTGLRGMLQPHWIANALKLQADPDRPGGFAEFRASFGGLFLLMHAFAIWMVLTLGAFDAALVSATVAMGWIGAAIGRVLSLVLDKTQNGTGGINRIWIGLELIIGGLLLAPMIAQHFPATS